jgi:hypothetical protein
MAAALRRIATVSWNDPGLLPVRPLLKHENRNTLLTKGGSLLTDGVDLLLKSVADISDRSNRGFRSVAYVAWNAAHRRLVWATAELNTRPITLAGVAALLRYIAESNDDEVWIPSTSFAFEVLNKDRTELEMNRRQHRENVRGESVVGACDERRAT